MGKKLKVLLIGLIAIVAILGLYRVLFIRTVNYELAGVRIPSEYNVLTGKISPIHNYKGNANLPSLLPRQGKNMGLSDGEIAAANLRWAIFEEWVKAHPEYKGWNSDSEIFKKANDAFRKELERETKAVVIR